MSAFFSGSETALTALSETRARMLMEGGRAGARFLKLWLGHPNRVLTPLLIGNSAVNTIIAALVTLMTERYFASSFVAVAVAVATVAILVFGEITPKTFAKQNAERMAPLVMPLVA